jgi:hypothetical protein
MPRCKFSHAEEDDPCSGNETKMYLETAIAEHHLLSPSIHNGTLNLPAAPSLLLFSLRSHYPSPRCKNLRSILRERGRGRGRGRQILARIFFRASEAPKLRTPLPNVENSQKNHKHLPIYYNLWQKKSKQQFKFSKNFQKFPKICHKL